MFFGFFFTCVWAGGGVWWECSELHSDNGCTALGKTLNYTLPKGEFMVFELYLNYLNKKIRGKEEAGEFHVSQKRFPCPSVPIRL